MADTNDSTQPKAPKSLEIKLENIRSTALARLIDEVRKDGNGEPVSATAYNRTYHRHNR